ncbi:sensor histidine kinase [Cryptosporangium sp. NPDC051539]|uniref:sensor histidine kinase n=1 Tax=Cryptosporangium sp. NPDC051539 TaxID=3363962 RepID=UPI0037950DF2
MPRIPFLRHEAVRAVLCAVGSGALVLLFGSPYWREHPVHGAVAALACGGFAASGALLATGGRRRRLTGWLLIAAAYCWPFAWLVSREHGLGPSISFFGLYGFFVLFGTAILSYPAGRLRGRGDRVWVVAAAIVLVGGEVVFQVFTEPEWAGLPPTVTWPSGPPIRAVWEIGMRAQAAGQIVLALWFAALLWRRSRWLSNLDRRIAIPVQVTAAALGLIPSIQAALEPGTWTDIETLQSFYFTEGVIALVVAIALVSGALRDRWWELSAPHRVVRITSSGTSVATVRIALADALRDGTLQLYFWAPSEDGWVDAGGVPEVAPAPAADDARWRIPISGDPVSGDPRSGGQQPLAIVDVDGSLRRRPLLVDAVLRAGGQALLTAQLQAAVSANLTQILAAKARLEEKRLAERQRLEQELHDGPQRQLGDLARRLERLTGQVSDPLVGSVAGECRDEVLATVGELEELAHGLLPAALRELGLHGALAAVADRLGLPVRLLVVPGRYPAAIEATLYFALCEGLTNVAKYAPGAAVRIEVTLADHWLRGVVIDDGPGGARIKPGGGLAGIAERARSLSGRASVESAPGETRVAIAVPLDSALVAS